jgi:hypothetical protein
MKAETIINKTVKTLITTIAVALLGSSLCQQTQAAPPIVGDIGFFGAASANFTSPHDPSVTISFANPWKVLSVTPGSTYEANGVPVFAALPAVTFSNFSFIGDGAGAALIAPNLPEWSFSFGGINYSFDLLSLTNGHVGLAGNNGNMSFSGLGIVHATGFEDTPASWSLQGAGNGLVFNLSSSTTASVPEGGVMSLLGLGFAMLAGRGLVRRNKSI